ncbi:MAG: response regulator, partial [Candidatus Sericytochromatia bacterium]
PTLIIQNELNDCKNNKRYIIKPLLVNKLKTSLIDIFYRKSIDNNLLENNLDINNIRRDIKILVVEDNKINQKVAVKTLKNLGYESDIADNGIEAINKINDKKYDLVFMDMQMPEMNGIEATIEIRKSNESLIIIALTANAMNEDKELCLVSGMNDYISKPLKIEEIKNIISKYFF